MRIVKAFLPALELLSLRLHFLIPAWASLKSFFPLTHSQSLTAEEDHYFKRAPKERIWNRWHPKDPLLWTCGTTKYPRCRIAILKAQIFRDLHLPHFKSSVELRPLCTCLLNQWLDCRPGSVVRFWALLSQGDEKHVPPQVDLLPSHLLILFTVLRYSSAFSLIMKTPTSFNIRGPLGPQHH